MVNTSEALFPGLVGHEVCEDPASVDEGLINNELAVSANLPNAFNSSSTSPQHPPPDLMKSLDLTYESEEADELVPTATTKPSSFVIEEKSKEVKRSQVHLETAIELAELIVHNGMKSGQVCQMFTDRYPHLYQSTPYRYARKLEYLTKEYETAIYNGIIRNRVPFCSKLNNAMLEWLNDPIVQSRVIITYAEAAAVAKEIADQLGIPDTNRVNFSKGWLRRLFIKAGMKFRVFHGEAGKVAKELVDKERARLHDIFIELRKTYADDEIWNFDETGIFFKAVPNNGITKKSRSGLAKYKDRVTFGLACNLAGETRDPLIISNAARHGDFRAPKSSTIITIMIKHG